MLDLEIENNLTLNTTKYILSKKKTVGNFLIMKKTLRKLYLNL